MNRIGVRDSPPGGDPRLPVNPVEVAPPGFPLLRGTRWGAEPAATLLLHAPGGGRDLDDWGDLPPFVARRTGLGVVALDLPGHGLSDGFPGRDDGPVPLAALILAVAAAPGLSGVRTAVAAGETAVALLRAAASIHLAGIVCLSPSPPEPNEETAPRSPLVPKLFLARSGVGGDIDRVRRLAAEVGGWAVVTGLVGPGAGVALIDGSSGAQGRDQIAGFLRDCLLRR